MPVAIFAGAQDKVIDFEDHAVCLHHEIRGSTLAIVPDAGHTVHHAVPDQIVLAVDGVHMPHLEPGRQAA